MDLLSDNNLALRRKRMGLSLDSIDNNAATAEEFLFFSSLSSERISINNESVLLEDEEDGSVNNILDALSSTTTTSIDHQSTKQEEDEQYYEHLYCQLDPFFNPPPPHIHHGSIMTSLSTPPISSIVKKDVSSFVPFIQQALLARYRWMLEEYLEPPPWYKNRAELDEICPVIYKEDNYGTTTSSRKISSSLDLTKQQLKQIPIHHIFNSIQLSSSSHMGPYGPPPSSSETRTTPPIWLEGTLGKTLLSLKLLKDWMRTQTYLQENEQTNLQAILSTFKLAVYIPLKEVKLSLIKFITKELIAKRTVASRIKSSTFIRCLESLENSLLIILDGLNEVTDGVLLKEIQDLLNGQLFPKAVIILTSSKASPMVNNNKFIINGMDKVQVESFIQKYFENNKRMLAVINDVQHLAKDPFLLLLLCFVFKEVGDLPSSQTELLLQMLRTLLYLKSGVSCREIPSKTVKHLQQLGKLLLTNETLNEKQICCSNLLKLGILTRPKVLFRKKQKIRLLHECFSEFLQAYYLESTVNTNNLKQELKLVDVSRLNEAQVKFTREFNVLNNLFELLKNRSAGVFLNLTEISINYTLAFLRSAGFYEGNLRAVCSKLFDFKSVSINSSSEWLSEWKQVLSSAHCQIESVEIVLKPNTSLNRLIEGLIISTSVNNVKFTTIPGSDIDVVEFSQQLMKLISLKRLESLEIRMTIFEDVEHEQFQPIIDVICYLPEIKKLVLDMDLTAGQVQQITSCLKDNIKILHLPHLGCGPLGLNSIAQLTNLSELNLSGCWKANSQEQENQIVLQTFPFASNYDLSSSVSTSSSLSRTRNTTTTQVKSPSIRRKKQQHQPTETSLTHPPKCDINNHTFSDGFHSLFTALRRDWNLVHLNISKSVLNWEDVICLGESIRLTRSLQTLQMEGMKLCDVLPILLALSENKTIKRLDLSSSHVVIADDALALAVNSLNKNTTLETLVIQGWQFHLLTLSELTINSNIVELDLTNCKINSSQKLSSLNCKKLTTLNLANVNLDDVSLPALSAFKNLKSLDLSVKSGTVVEEKIFLKRLKIVSDLKLNELIIKNYKVKLSIESKSCKEISKLINCNCLTLDSSEFSLANGDNKRVDAILLELLINKLTHISWAAFPQPQLINKINPNNQSQATIRLDNVPLNLIRNLDNSQYIGNHTIRFIKPNSTLIRRFF